MRTERTYIKDVLDTPEDIAAGKRDATNQVNAGTVTCSKPFHVITGVAQKHGEGYVGIYVEPLHSNR